ncbi:MAG: helix-turn-helix transcriptional regulator [Spirochaetia bacterium]|nr:helix-turn-helix transcriptional regulator [Spirochaetia bacterium]
MKTIKFLRSPPIDPECFHINAIGIREPMKPAIVDRPKGTGDWLFMYFYEAAVANEKEGSPESDAGTKKPFLIIWPEGTPHLYGHKSRPWLHTWFHASGSRIAPLLLENKIPVFRKIPLDSGSLLEKYLLSFYQELTTYVREDKRLVENLFENFLRELARSIAPDTSAAIPDFIVAARAWVESNFPKNFSVAGLSAASRLSEAHFGVLYKKATGFSPLAHAVELRLLHASALLENRNLKVSEVAAQVGYQDLYHFSKLFKKRFGKSPRNFRERSNS